MEVDLQPATESRHSSPFARMHSPVSVTASTSASTSVSPAPSAGQRYEQKKRRRGGYTVTSGDSTNKRTGTSYYEEEEEEEAAGFDDGERAQAAGPSSKRRNILVKRFSDDTSHHYRSLGVATGLNGVWLSDSEYGVDSPMHSLSLASPSPPLTPVVASETDGGSDCNIGGTNDDDDIDMGSSETAAPSASPTLPLIPRQVMHRSHSTPFRPSPLIQAQAFASSSQSSNSNSSRNEASNAHACNISLSPIHVPENTDLERIKRDDIADSFASSSSKASSPQQQQSRPGGRAATPILLDGENRTPSPRPSSFSSPADDTPSKGSRRLHHSPGLTQTSFPGGKHMLRYTMGYREDCDACKSKTPGHYGHVMHR